MNYLDLKIEKIKNLLSRNDLITSNKKVTRIKVIEAIVNEASDSSNYKNFNGTNYFSSKIGMGIIYSRPILLFPCMYIGINLLYKRIIFTYDTFEDQKCFPFAIENELAKIRKHNKTLYKLPFIRKSKFIALLRKKESDSLAVKEMIKKYGIENSIEYIKSFIELFDINKNDLINANEYEGLLYEKIHENMNDIKYFYTEKLKDKDINDYLNFNSNRLNSLNKLIDKIKNGE